MFARISTFRGPPEQTAEGIRVARRQFLPAARLQEGFRGMYLMLDAASGRSLAVTLWETEEDMARSEGAVRRARRERRSLRRVGRLRRALRGRLRGTRGSLTPGFSHPDARRGIPREPALPGPRGEPTRGTRGAPAREDSKLLPRKWSSRVRFRRT